MSRLTPSEVRPVELKILPDGRKRLTRFRVINAGFGIIDTLVKPWGTLDAGPVDAAHQREGFANLRLVNQFSAEPGTADVSPEKLVWVEVYETLPATAEVQVGGTTTTKLEDGRTALLTEALQFSASAYVPGTVGTTVHPTDAAAFLQEAKATDDGTLRRITRSYVYEGILSTDEQIREGGALTLKTIVSVKTVPTTPAGYTLIGKPTQNPAGLPVYSYAYAKGTGLVFTQERKALDGAITYQTKRAYGTPVDATGEFDTSTEQGNGYTVYVSRGIIITTAALPDEVTTRNKGKLVITRKRKINAAPTGTGSVIFDSSEREEGYTLYTRAYAVGEGLVSTSTRDHLNGAITYTTKRAYGTPVAATGEFETTTEDDDGYTIYVSRGLVINTTDLPDEVTTRNKGNLVITRKRKINAAPTGTGSVIFASADREEGYTLYTRAYAVGEGVVSTSTRDHLNGAITYTTKRAYGTPVAATGEFETTTENDDGYTVYVSRGLVINTLTLPDRVETRNQGKLVITRRSKINSAPSTPAATLGGSVVRTDLSPVPEEGYTLYSAEFAEGVGTIRRSTRQSNNGKLTTHRHTALGGWPIAPTGTGTVGSVAMVDTGGGYASAPAISFIGGGGSGAAATANLTSATGQVSSLTVYPGQYGSGWVTGDTVRINGNGSGCTASVIASGGAVSAILILTPGSGYTFLTGLTVLTGSPTVNFGFNYTLATGNILSSITVTAPGSGYTTAPAVVITGGSPATPASATASLTAIGALTQIDAEEEDQSGVTLYTIEWASGSGVISTRTQQRPGGLRLVTWVSLGQAYDASYMLPAGILMAKDADQRDGHVLWTVTTMQTAAGGADPTSGSALSVAGKHPFRYPGRAKAISTTILGSVAYDVYRSPPIDVLVDATTTISYSTTASLGALPATLWNPDSWATIIASYWTLSGWPKAVIESLPGYRAISETPLAFTGMLVSCLGELCYATGSGTPYSIAVKGGPANPETNTYTLAAEVDPEPAFVAYDGTKYYRRTFVTATIPMQTALPV